MVKNNKPADLSAGLLIRLYGCVMGKAREIRCFLYHNNISNEKELI
jgi:hypothetical protein